MKINGFQVEEHGSGYAVTLRLHVGREEALDGMTSSADGVVLGALAAALAATVNIEGVNSYDAKAGEKPVPGAETSRVQSKDHDAKAEPPAGGRRVNRGGSKTEDKEPGDPTSGSATAAGSKGRRRRASTAKTTSRSEEGKEPEGPTPGGALPQTAKRRQKSETSTAGTAKRTQTTKSRSRKKATKITDEDLTKAASQAAAELGAPVVMDLVAEFNVEKVGDLDAKQRVKFKARLAEEREKANE